MESNPPKENDSLSEHPSTVSRPSRRTGSVLYPERIPTHRIDKDAIKVIKRLSRNGHTAYLVGGSVRDLLLGRQPKDYDIGTSARPTEVRKLFRNCRLIGRRFRLAHILFAGGKIIEVATFRRDPGQDSTVPVQIEGGLHENDDTSIPAITVNLSALREDQQDLLIRRDNAFGNPEEDAIRRDFTINGLFYDISERTVIDYVGGIPDLRKGIVRTIGRPDVRFREDPIRILRAIKFCAQLDFGMIPDLYDSAVNQRFELKRCAPPRLLEDTLRLMRGGAAQRAIYLALDLGVLNILFPYLTAFIEDNPQGAELLWRRLWVLDQIVGHGALPSDSVLLAALLLESIKEAIEGTHDPSSAFQEFFLEVGPLMAIPRKIKDRIQRIVMAQSKLRQGKLRGLMQRDFYPDAISLFELQSRALGEELPEWVSSNPVSHTAYLRHSRHRKMKW